MKTKLALALFRFVGTWSLGATRFIGAGLGRLFWLCRTRGATTAIANIDLCFPDLPPDERQRLARDSIIEFGKTCFELPLVMQRSPQWVHAKIVKTHNQALFDQALADERGVLLFCPHMGNWEVSGIDIGKQTVLTIMYEPSSWTELDAIVKSSRSRLGANLVPTDKRGVLALIKALRAGGVAGILPDQVPAPESGVFAPFFGMPALTMTLCHKLVQRTGAQALVTCALRVPGGFEVYYDRLEPEFFSDDEKVSLTAMNSSLEKIVRRAPEQYQWEYKRFKRLPKGMGDIYP